MSQRSTINLGVASVDIEFHREQPRGWSCSPVNCWADCEVADARYDTAEDATRAAIRWAYRILAEERRILRSFVTKFKSHN